MIGVHETYGSQVQGQCSESINRNKNSHFNCYRFYRHRSLKLQSILSSIKIFVALLMRFLLINMIAESNAPN